MAENNKQATPQDQEQDLSQVLRSVGISWPPFRRKAKTPSSRPNSPSPTTPRRSKSTLTRWKARP